jgi:hypothetical protein
VLDKTLPPPELAKQSGKTVNIKIHTQQNGMRTHLRCEVDSKLTGEVLHSLPACTVLLLCFDYFIDVYCYLFNAALEFMLTQVKGIALRILYAHACREIRAASGTWIST